MCSLGPSVVVSFEYAARNVAYNAVCLFEKPIQVFHAKDGGRNGLAVVCSQHLVQHRRDIHGVVVVVVVVCLHVSCCTLHEMTSSLFPKTGARAIPAYFLFAKRSQSFTNDVDVTSS